MQIEVSVASLIVSGVALCLVGVAVGRLASRRDRRTRHRLEELEATLIEEREERVRYESQVAKHFDQTSELFGDLTRQYTALYAHLAEGSRELCREAPASLAAGFGAPPASLTLGQSQTPPELGVDASASDSDEDEATADPQSEDAPDEPVHPGEH